ncbi:helix-turn-helix transcriptional regulator [Actinokineospora auranticolor]|uniref:Helix-turn-helix protein n=1 Tax=Actinokineospora auranticolor TaxID=155976 RepID=A0A2S6GRF6_9PSEU|nr:helix-turn-helix transcriptional regulator [Actinokineospora auranticolor]PPK67822.1 helix-turn-helix protein [Actinokineospora auranticolor]
MEKREPTIRSRELGDGMRAAMDRARLNGVRTAQRLGWSKSKLSRMLLGTRGVSPGDLAAFFEVCAVTEDERDRMFKLCAEMRVPGWFRVHEARLPARLRTVIDHELQASTITEFSLNALPALLRTDDYARALIAAKVTVEPEEAEERLVARSARRQRLKTDSSLNTVFYLHEFALRLPVGDGEVMSDQLHDLLRMSVRDHITVRVVPAAAGAHAGLGGGFRLLEFLDFKPVVHLAHELSWQFLDRPGEVTAYRAVVDALDRVALEPDESRVLIADIAVAAYGGGLSLAEVGGLEQGNPLTDRGLPVEEPGGEVPGAG